MEILAQYEIPYLHPLMVHFPLVMILLGGGTAAMWLIRATEVWKNVTTWLFGLSMVFSIASKQTGETLADSMEGEALLKTVLEAHEQGADLTVLLNVLIVVVLLFVWFSGRFTQTKRFENATWLRGLLAVLALAAAVMVAYTAHLGGIMTWGVPA